MKKMTLFLLVFLFSHSAFSEVSGAHSRSNGLLRFLAQQHGVRDFALHTILNNRCSRYMPRNEKSACKEATKKMIKLLDYDIIFPEKKGPPEDETWTPSSFVFVAFKKNFITLLSQERTGIYLNDLNQKLYGFILGRKSRPNVWDVTRSHFQSDYLTALALATLFQDTSPMKLHLAWLEHSNTRGNANFQSNKELLMRVIDTINLILDSSEDNYRALFYPEEIQRNLNRNIYHFYVPMYLSMALEKSGLSKNAAYSGALMLTLSYEFVTSSKDYRYLYNDPKTIESAHKVKDIFGGYCGSNIGVRGMNFNKSFTVIRESFLRSTEDAVELLLRH